MNADINSDACYCLAADIGITTTVGTSAHPFCGVFDGGGHTLTANLSGTDYFVAPFSANMPMTGSPRPPAAMTLNSALLR